MIVDWYFDFVSPFAYLQSEQLDTLPRGISVRYRPVLLAALLEANGQRGPAEIPAKRAFTYRFCLWQAKRLGVPLRFPPEHPFNPLPLLRLAIACDSSAQAVHAIFRFVWRDGRLLGTCTLNLIEHLAHGFARSAILEDMLVDSRARGQGIGQALVGRAAQRAREWGCYKLALSSHQDREAAHRFYAAHGVSLALPLD